MVPDAPARRPALLHGLRIASDLELGGSASAGDEPPDLTIRLRDAAPVGTAPPPGEVVAAFGDATRGYVAVVADGVLHVRFLGVADLHHELGASHLDVTPDPSADPGLVAILVAGNGLALLLGLRDACTLHASAVLHDGRALAFVGASGAGKSTLATLMARRGAALVGDDLLRVAPPASVHRGSAETRLRPGAAGLAERLEARTTADGRTAVRPAGDAPPVVPLALLAFPAWDPGAEQAVTARPLTPRECFERLLRSPRITGWKAAGPTIAHFRACAALAEQVPGVALELRHGAPLDDELAAALDAALQP